MRRALFALGAAVITMAVLLPGAFGRTQATPGVTAKSITLGGTFPLSGPASSYAPIPVGMAAYFSYVNATKGPDGKRGVGGRQIVWKYYDDGYNPANTVQRTHQLVEQDHVFALIGGLGTEPQLAVEDYLNQQKVPQVYVSTGATEFGSEYAKYPWTIGWQPDYQAEGAIYGKYIAANEPNAKIGVLYQNDAYGSDYLEGLRAGLGAKKSQIVDTAGYDVTNPSLLSQILELRKAGATTLMIFATPSPTITAYATMAKIGWKPAEIYVNSVSATQTFMGIAVQLAGAAEVNGSISTYYLKDPANPSWNNTPGMKLYNQIMAKYAPKRRPEERALPLRDGQGVRHGPGAAHDRREPHARVVHAQAVLNSTISGNPFALPTVKTTTGPKDHFPISQQRLIRFADGQWTPFGQLIDPRK